MKSLIDNPMPPPWLMYPHIPKGSIGWRMGYGEEYMGNHCDWLNTLCEDEKLEYQKMFPRPKSWNLQHENGVGIWHKNDKILFTKEKQNEFIFFWKIGDLGKGCLSQWKPSKFKFGHLSYSCAEQYMMAEKARIFKDEETYKKISKTTEPKKIKELGKSVSNFDEDVWDKFKYSIVVNANYYKFNQNKEMRDFLISTGEKILVEASPLDKVWGIGISEENPNATNPEKWRGQNLLGFALMEVRSELRLVYENYDKIDWSLWN